MLVLNLAKGTQKADSRTEKKAKKHTRKQKLSNTKKNHVREEVTWVVLPQPVLPRMSMTGCPLICSMMVVFMLAMGSPARSLARRSRDWSVFCRSDQSWFRSSLDSTVPIG